MSLMTTFQGILLRRSLNSIAGFLKQRLWWMALVVLAIPALQPFLTYGLQRSFDGEIHLLRLALLDYHIQHGTLYPRWLPELMLGQGAPILNYYAPLTYYLAEVFHLIGLSYTSAMMAGMALLVLVAGWGMFLLARDIYGSETSWAALVAATAYMYAPYLLTNIFIRGAVAEVGGQAVLPWLLWSVYRLMHHPKPTQYILPLVASLSALVLAHNLTPLLAAPMLIGFFLVCWRSEHWSPQRLPHLAFAIALSATLTGFFWVPMIFERTFLTQGAYDLAASLFLPNNSWHWNNFLDLRLLFNYNFGVPVQLGLVQILLAFAGMVLARRRDMEWLFLATASILIGASIGAWTLPIWLSNPILTAVQFPWRLLSLLSLSLALLTGGVALGVRCGWLRIGIALLLLGLIVFANTPRLAWLEPQSSVFADLTLAKIAQYEKDTGSMGGRGYTNEFTPLWAGINTSPSSEDAVVSPLQVKLHEGNAFTLHGTLASTAGGQLLFTTFYFPGWQVMLDKNKALKTYPATGTGHLSVDVPPGSHEFTLAWVGTPLQHLAAAISLAALAILALFLWRRLHMRNMALVVLAVLCAGIVTCFWSVPSEEIHTPEQRIEMANMQLVGYRFERERADTLTLYPYWFVASRQPNYRLHWQLKDHQGQVVSEITQTPYFDTAYTSDWPEATPSILLSLLACLLNTTPFMFSHSWRVSLASLS